MDDSGQGRSGSASLEVRSGSGLKTPLSRLLLEGRFPPKSTSPVDVDPIRDPGVFRFEKPVH